MTTYASYEVYVTFNSMYMNISYLDEVLLNVTNPEKAAIISEDNSLSYRKLNDLSTAISRDLSLVITTPNEAIVVFIDKSFSAIITIFGILKAGACYIPIDVELPEEKILYIIEKSKTKIIITTSENYNKLENISLPKSIRVLEIALTSEFDISLNTLNSHEELNPGLMFSESGVVRSPNDLAYIIFTSGSTGNPKAVMISHRSVVAFIPTMNKITKYDEDTRFLNVNPFHFDASIADIYCTLAAKGTVILFKKLVLPSDIVKHLEYYKVTDTLLQSALLKILASRYSNLEHSQLKCLKTIWYGGEGCPIKYLKIIKQSIPQITFIHGYGPTETTHTATYMKFSELPETMEDFMPIGKPLDTIIAYALNEQGQVIEGDETGELYIGGVQLMSGYFNDPDRTAEVLTKNLFNPDTLAYKTGDVVKLDSQGNYIFISRTDDLIKIDGILVSTIEIQNTLLSHPRIKDVIIVKKADYFHNNKLCAAIVKSDEGVKREDVLQFLKYRLPKYMIPEEILFFEEFTLPRNTNGKINKKMLIEMFD